MIFSKGPSATNVLKGQQLICAICQSDFEQDDSQVSLKRCKKNTHSFHISCLDRWEREQRFLYNEKPPQWKLLNPFLLQCTICKVIYKAKDRSDWNESQSRERNESAITPIDLTNDNQDTHIRNQNWRHSRITNLEALNEAERIVTAQQSSCEHRVLEHDISLREMYRIIGFETTGTRYIDETTRTYPHMAFSSEDLTGAVRRAMHYREQYANDRYEEWVEEKEDESVEIESDDDGNLLQVQQASLIARNTLLLPPTIAAEDRKLQRKTVNVQDLEDQLGYQFWVFNPPKGSTIIHSCTQNSIYIFIKSACP